MKPYISNKNPLERKFSTLKLALVLSLGLFLLIFPNSARAYLFEDNFDSYDVGSLTDPSQGSWSRSWSAGSDWFATTSQAQSGSISAVRNPPAGTYCLKKTGEAIDNTGYFSFWIYVDNFATTTNYTRFSLDVATDTCSGEPYPMSIFLRSPTSTEELSVFGSGDGSSENYLENIGQDEWIFIEMSWNLVADTIKYRIDNGSWRQFALNDPVNEVDTFYWFTPSSGLLGDIYLDTLKTLGICGSGDNCVLCYSQSDCEMAGCYWVEMPFPFVSNCIATLSPIETATGTQFDFDIYYATNSQFSTPTAFITGIAEATQPFLVILSSWLENFSDLFDLLEAQEKGQQLGSAIPQARGYLDFFNSLFSNLPLSEILLVYLVVLVGLIIFRIIRQIKKLIAF